MTNPDHYNSYNGETTFISEREQLQYQLIVHEQDFAAVAKHAQRYDRLDVFMGTKRRAAATIAAGIAMVACVSGGVMLARKTPLEGSSEHWPMPNMSASVPAAPRTETADPGVHDIGSAPAVPPVESPTAGTDATSPVSPPTQPGGIANHLPEITQHSVMVIPSPISS
jgi:hypothetical protein